VWNPCIGPFLAYFAPASGKGEEKRKGSMEGEKGGGISPAEEGRALVGALSTRPTRKKE